MGSKDIDRDWSRLGLSFRLFKINLAAELKLFLPPPFNLPEKNKIILSYLQPASAQQESKGSAQKLPEAFQTGKKISKPMTLIDGGVDT